MCVQLQAGSSQRLLGHVSSLEQLLLQVVHETLKEGLEGAGALGGAAAKRVVQAASGTSCLGDAHNEACLFGLCSPLQQASIVGFFHSDAGDLQQGRRVQSQTRRARSTKLQLALIRDSSDDAGVELLVLEEGEPCIWPSDGAVCAAVD